MLSRSLWRYRNERRGAEQMAQKYDDYTQCIGIIAK